MSDQSNELDKMTAFSKVAYYLDKGARFCMIFFLVFCAALILLQVFARYFFGLGFNWTEELSRYSGMLVALFGISPLIRLDEDLRVDLFYQKSRKSLTLSLLVDLFMVFCLITLFIKGWEFTLFGMKSRTPGARIPFGVIYMAMPLCSLLGLVQLADRWINNFKQKNNSGEKVY